MDVSPTKMFSSTRPSGWSYGSPFESWNSSNQGLTHAAEPQIQTASNNVAVKLRGRLVTTKYEVDKLPLDKVWPNLQRLISAVDNNLALATSIVRGRRKVELTGILKEDLLKTSTIATKLIVPDGKRERSTYSGLRKVRRLLKDCTRIAAKLHEDVSCRGDSLYKSRGSTCTATSSTTNVSTHWKPSLNCTFFLKPATLTGFKGMTTEYAQSLATALANQDQPLKNNNTVSKKPTNSVNYGATCRDLNRALQSVPVKSNKNASKEPVRDTSDKTSEPVVSGDDKHVLLVMAIKIRNRLTRVQSDSNKLSSSVETQSLDMMKQYLDGVKQLVENIIKKPVSAKMTAMLKTNLQNTLAFVNKLHDTCNKTDQVGVRVLSRLRCILEMCGKIATNLHIQIEVTLKSLSKQSTQDQQQSTTTPSSSTQAASADSASIMRKLAIQTEVSTTHISQVETDSNCSIQHMESDTRATTVTVQNTHWKPSMDCKFFLKPPTLVYKGMTKENLKSLATALATDDAKTNNGTNSNADVVSKQSGSKDINYDDACKDLSDALQLTPSQSKQPNKKESTRLPLTLEEKRQASKRLANKLSLCLIAVQRELSRLSPGAVRSSLDDLKIAVDNASSLAIVVSRAVRIEMTSLLLDDLQDTMKLAKKQRVPANKKEQSTSRGLSRAKRLLEVGVRMADALHNQAVVFSKNAAPVSSSTTSVHSSSTSTTSEASTSTVPTACTVTTHTESITNVNAQHTTRSKKTPRQKGCTSRSVRKTTQAAGNSKFPKRRLPQLLQIKRNANGTKKQPAKIDVGSKRLMLEHFKLTKSTESSSGSKGKCRKVTFATELVSVPKYRSNFGCASVKQQPDSSDKQQPTTSSRTTPYNCTRKNLPKPILKPAIRLQNSSSSDVTLFGPSLIIHVNPNGVDREVTIVDDNDDIQHEAAPRIRLGKRSCSGNQSLTPLKQRKFS